MADNANIMKEEAKKLFETKTGLKVSSEKGAKIFNNAFNSVMATAMNKTAWRTLMTAEASNILQDMTKDFDALPAEKPKPKSETAAKKDSWHVNNFLKPNLFDNPQHTYRKDYKGGAVNGYVTLVADVCNAIRKATLMVYWENDGKKPAGYDDTKLCKEVAARLGLQALTPSIFKNLKSKMKVADQKKLISNYIEEQVRLGNMKPKTKRRPRPASVERKVITLNDLGEDWGLKKKD